MANRGAEELLIDMLKSLDGEVFKQRLDELSSREAKLAVKLKIANTVEEAEKLLDESKKRLGELDARVVAVESEFKARKAQLDAEYKQMKAELEEKALKDRVLQRDVRKAQEMVAEDLKKLASEKEAFDERIKAAERWVADIRQMENKIKAKVARINDIAGE